MKNCKSIEKKQIAYLHGELNTSDARTVEQHLAGCEACRAEFEAHRATLSLLGEALATAPAPAELPAWGFLPNRAPAYRPKRRFDKGLFKVQLASFAVSSGAHLLLLMLMGVFVVFSVMEKPENYFCPPPVVNRPKMELKKPRVKLKKNIKPKATRRIVAKNVQVMADIQLPEMSSGIGGLSGGIGGFDMMPDASEMSLYGSSKSIADGSSFEEDKPAYQAGLAARQLKRFEKGVPVEDSRSESLAFSYAEEGAARGKLSEPRAAPAGTKIAAAAREEKEQDTLSDSVKKNRAYLDTGLAEAVPASGQMLASSDTDFDRVSGDLVLEDSLRLDRVMPEPKPKPAPLVCAMEEDTQAERRRIFARQLKRLKKRSMKPAVFNPYVLADENAFSTFSIDVDTASYGLARNRLLGGGLPDPEQVRTEEFINSFDYDYRPPTGKQTFSVHSEMAPSPFRTGMDVLKVGIKGRRIGRDDHRGAVLTLVIDTSGSMSTPERLGLVKESLALLLNQLGPDDVVAIVQFGGEARLVREHTPASDKAALLEAINALEPGGPTQFDKGLELGYQLAMNGFRAGDSNRIIILSDGVANLGELDPEAILKQVVEQRKQGIYLSVLGFGAGTYDDDLLERLANRGDGMYAYIDTLDEARHLLVDQLAATLHVIASDVKIQIEFNPARVLRYRQLGYENRQLTKEQFRDDTVDAGEVGSGQSVTALYDIELKPDGPEREPIATVYVRYRRADNSAIEEISSRVTDRVRRTRFADAEPRFQLAACTAEFAERLRRSPYAGGTEMKDIFGRLQPVALELDLDGQVQELLRLISVADGLER